MSDFSTETTKPAPGSRPEGGGEGWAGSVADFKTALGFLTRLPIGGIADGNLARAARFFPIVGLIVGLVSAAVFGSGSLIGLPPLFAGLAAILVSVLITGGLHEDGLADSADGFGAGGAKEKILAIMADSRSGSFGVLALILSVGLRAAALAALGPGPGAAALIAAHVFGRGLLPLVMAREPLARSGGLAAAAGRPSDAQAAIAFAVAALFVMLELGLADGAIAMLIAIGLAMLLLRHARRRIGGYNGDLLGAIEQISEIVILGVAAATFAGRAL